MPLQWYNTSGGKQPMRMMMIVEEIDFKQFATKFKKFLRELRKYEAGTAFRRIEGAKGHRNGLCYLIAQTLFTDKDGNDIAGYNLAYKVVSHFMQNHGFDKYGGYLPECGVLTQERKDLCEIMLKGLNTKSVEAIYEEV